MDAVTSFNFIRTELLEDYNVLEYNISSSNAVTPYEIVLLHDKHVDKSISVEKMDCIDALQKLGLNDNNFETAIIGAVCVDGISLIFEYTDSFKYFFFSDGAVKELVGIVNLDDTHNVFDFIDNAEAYEAKLKKNRIVHMQVMNFTCRCSKNNYVFCIEVGRN